MKKLLPLCLLLLFCTLLILPVSAAQTSGSYGDNLLWIVEDGVLTITGTGPMTGYSAQLTPEWSEIKMEVTELIIGEGVTTIGSNAFPHFENLTKVTLPSTLETIESQAFLWCKSLTAIEIPSSVTLIKGFAFSKCYALEEIVIPANAEVRGDAFTESTGLKKVTFLGGGKLHMDVFKECSGLQEIHFYGDVPAMMDPFTDVTATAYYPAWNTTWTEDKLQNYGGTLTWKRTECDHKEVTDAEVPPTCTKTGLTAGKHCSVCGKVLVAQQTVPTTDHKYGEWYQTKAPTTQEVGKEQRKCKSCTQTQERDIPKLQEPPTEPPTAPPTEPPAEPPTAPPTAPPTEPPTAPTTDPTPTEVPADPEPTPSGTDDQFWLVVISAGILMLAGGAAAAWFFVIRRRK